MTQAVQANQDAFRVFTNGEFGNLRTLAGADGKLWFVANDVAGALGYVSPKNAVKRRCKYAELFRGTETVPLEINPFGIMIIPISDVLRLIVNSKLPAAQKYEAWVFDEVLPAIHQYGHYGKPQACPPLESRLAAIEERVAYAERRGEIAFRRIEEDAVYTAAGKRQAGISGWMSIAVAANWMSSSFPPLKITRTGLFKWMRNHGAVYKRGKNCCLPTALGIKRGWLKIQKRVSTNKRGYPVNYEVAVM